LFSKRDSDGRPKKTSFGAWILPLFSLLAALRKLRGTPFDIFGLSKHRKMERSLPIEFESLIETLMTKLTAANADEVAAIADLYNNVRGYDVVKDRNVERTRAYVARRLKALTSQNVSDWDLRENRLWTFN
jgi:indolepyruvate ferredoxin oxidoreductase